jgi:hypothetical protein
MSSIGLKASAVAVALMGFVTVVPSGAEAQSGLVRKYGSRQPSLDQSVLNAHRRGMNKNNEMSMIQLQSLMSQRQTAIQMTTKLMNDLGKGTQEIAKNIRP